MSIYDIMLIENNMIKIKKIPKIPNLVAKNLLETRYRKQIIKNKKKYNRKRDKDVCDSTS